MTEPRNAKPEEQHWPYACRNCPARAQTVGQLFDHIRTVHEKDPLARNSRVPLIIPPNQAPALPPPPEVDVEDFIQYNTIIRPGEEDPVEQEAVSVKQEDIVVVESEQPTAPSEPTTYGCPLCKFESRNEGKVQRHIDRHYVVEQPPLSSAAEVAAATPTPMATLIVDDQVLPDDGIYECGICHDQTTSIEEMVQHMVTAHQNHQIQQ